MRGWKFSFGVRAAFIHLRVIASVHLKNRLALAIKDPSGSYTIPMPAIARPDLPGKTPVHKTALPKNTQSSLVQSARGDAAPAATGGGVDTGTVGRAGGRSTIQQGRRAGAGHALEVGQRKPDPTGDTL